MPLDALCLSAVKNELREYLIGLKIDKVQQPERDVIVLSLRGTESCRLLISTGTGDARVHLTKHRFENPAAPPMFCMLLRKHLTGARIRDIIQPPSERILNIYLDAPDALGAMSEKCLIVELIGRQPNLILTNTEGIIIDCQRRVTGDISTGKRHVLPGAIYRAPPPQEGKLNPLTVTQTQWEGVFLSCANSGALDKWLNSAFSALSPLICREIAYRAYGASDMRRSEVNDGGDALRREFFELVRQVEEGKAAPYIISDESNTPRDFSFTRIRQYEGVFSVEQRPDFSELLESFYTRSSQLERVRQRAQAMTKTVKNARDRQLRKLVAQREELEKTKDRDKLRECADIITANMHLMKKGQNTLTAQDFYSEHGGMRDIALDPLKTPQQNAAKYYKEYNKAKNAGRFLAEQITKGEGELKYLESVLQEIALAEGERDLTEIRTELVHTGYIKAHSRDKKQAKAKESAPMRFLSSTGMTILAGRNNTQNDTLTNRTASKTDVWLHVKEIHGSHVIISCKNEKPDETTLSEAASIAAYYSSARSGGKVPVDYCQVRHVKKQPGGRPGMVIYTDYKTIIAVSDEELVKRLKQE